MKKPLHILLATACILALSGCEGVNIPGAYSQAPVTQQAAEAQAESTVNAPVTIAPPSDTAVSDLTAPDATTTPDAPATADTTPQAQTGASAPAPAQPAAPQQTQTGTGTATDIGEAKAREIALAHAQLKESDVTFIKSHPDYDDGRYVYDVEFYKDMTEYDYEIDAYTGDIISFDFDVENYAIAVPQQQPKAPAQPASPQQPQAPAQQQTAGNITLDQAKAAALQRAGLSSATFTKAHLDYDDGIAVYEIEFIAGTMEYDVEVDARTGAVREFDAESIYDD